MVRTIRARTSKKFENCFEIKKCFLRETEKTSSAYGLRIDLSKGDDVDGSTGLFAMLGIAGLLEASEYGSIDKVSSFFLSYS